MPKPKPKAPTMTAEKIAWSCLLAVPALVPLVLGRVPFAPTAAFTLGHIAPKFFAFCLLVSASLIAWAVGCARGEIELRNPAGKWWLAGFLALACLSTATALSPTISFFGEPGQLLGLITLLVCATMYFLAVQMVTSPSRIAALARAAVVGGVVVAVVGLLQSLGADPIGSVVDPTLGWMARQAYSTIGNPDSTGTYLVFPLVLSAALALGDNDRNWRVISGVSFAVIAYTLFVTLTRGAWIGGLVGIIVLLILVRRSSKKAPRPLLWLGAGLLALLAAGVVQAGPMVARRFTELTSGATAGGGRLIIWREALKIIASHPLLGVGPDSYRYGWYPIRLPQGMLAAGDVLTNDPHNMVLLFAATVGIPATVVLLVFLGMVVVKSTRFALSTEGGTHRLVFAGWWAASIGFSAALFFTFNTIPAMIAFWLCLGVLSAPGARIVASVRRPIVLSIAVSAVIFGAGAVLVSGLTLASDYNVAVAKSQQSLSAADAAVQLAPWYYSARVEQAYETGLQAVLATQQKSADAAVRVKTAEDTMGRLVAFNPHALTGYDLQSAFLLEIGSSQNDTTVLERAVSAAEGGLKIQPTSISLATRKAQALAALGRNDQAATVMSAAWELYPGDPAPGVLYAQLLLDAGKAQDAKRVSATLTTRFPAEASVRQLAAQTQAPGAQ